MSTRFDDELYEDPTEPIDVSLLFVDAATPKHGVSPWRLRSKRVEQLIASAREHLQCGDVPGAHRYVKLALGFDPKDPFARRLRDDIELERAQARAHDMPVHRIARGWYGRALQAIDRGNLPRAVELLEKALEFSKEAVICNQLGVLLMQQRRELRRAAHLIRIAVERAPSVPLYAHNLARITSLI